MAIANVNFSIVKARFEGKDKNITGDVLAAMDRLDGREDGKLDSYNYAKNSYGYHQHTSGTVSKSHVESRKAMLLEEQRTLRMDACKGEAQFELTQAQAADKRAAATGLQTYIDDCAKIIGWMDRVGDVSHCKF